MSKKLVVAIERQIAALVPRFLAHRVADVGKLRAAVADADFETIRVAAHAMKGAGGPMAFPRFRGSAPLWRSARERAMRRRYPGWWQALKIILDASK